MAIREGDIQVQKAAMSSLLEKAEASEAAFYDPITQGFNFATEVAGSVGTVMNLTPKNGFLHPQVLELFFHA